MEYRMLDKRGTTTAIAMGFSRPPATSAPIVTANNYAQADVSSCSHCGATAIAFQVVLVSKHTLAELSATDAAQATTENCTTCHSLAEAFQIVYATDKWSVVRWEVQAAAYRVAFQLRMLQYSHLSWLPC